MRSVILIFVLAAMNAAGAPAGSEAPNHGHQMQHHQPGMRMDDSGQTKAAQNPAEQSTPGASVQDILKDVKGRPAMDLNQFEQLALANNPTLKQANALVRQSAGLAKQAGLLPNPSIGYQGEQIRGGSYHGGEQGAFVQQTFVLGGKLGLRRDVYEQQRREAETGVEEQRYRVFGGIGRQFYATLAAQETVNIRAQLVQLALDAVETAHQLANVGQADAPDVLQSEVEAEQAKLDYTTAQRTFLQQFATLSALAGRVNLPPSPLKGNLETYPTIDAGHVVDHLIKNSPSVKLAEQDIARAQAQVKSSKRESIPDLQVRAGLENNFERLGESGATPVGVQGFVTAGITLPLFNRNQGNVTAGKADLERARLEVNRVRFSLQQAAQPVVQDYLSAQAEASRYKTEIIPRATKAYQLYLEKYLQMGAAYPQVIVSQRTLFQLKIAYVSVLERLWQGAITLQNFLLSDGLAAPQAFGNSSLTINLPAASAAGAQ